MALTSPARTAAGWMHEAGFKERGGEFGRAAGDGGGVK